MHCAPLQFDQQSVHTRSSLWHSTLFNAFSANQSCRPPPASAPTFFSLYCTTTAGSPSLDISAAAIFHGQLPMSKNCCAPSGITLCREKQTVLSAFLREAFQTFPKNRRICSNFWPLFLVRNCGDNNNTCDFSRVVGFDKWKAIFLRSRNCVRSTTSRNLCLPLFTGTISREKTRRCQRVVGGSASGGWDRLHPLSPPRFAFVFLSPPPPTNGGVESLQVMA